MNTRTRCLTSAAALATAFLSINAGAGTAHAAVNPTLSLAANGCDFTFTTVNGQGAADAWTASFSVDGHDAGTWGSGNDVEVLTNWISRDFAPGGLLTVTWEVVSVPGNSSLSTGTIELLVPACELPYQIHVHKVVSGQPPAGGFTVNVWNADGDGGLTCAPQGPSATQTVNLPAAGGDANVRATPGHWCVQEIERRGALETTYSSNGGSMLGAAHVVTVPPAPGVTSVTITNVFAGSVGSGGLPATGRTTAVLAWFAGAVLAAGLFARRLAVRTEG